MSDQEEKPAWGTVQCEGKDIATVPMQADRLAISSRSELLLMSIIAATQNVKQVRAILSGGAKATVSANGVRVKKKTAKYWESPQNPGRLYGSVEGYTCLTHKLGYGLAHAIFITKKPGFLKLTSSEALWHELNENRFTTPILSEWMPWLEKEMRADDTLEEALCFNCDCGLLSATTTTLDNLVVRGLQDREIEIPVQKTNVD